MLLLTKSHVLMVLIVWSKSNRVILLSAHRTLKESGSQVVYRTMQSIMKLFGPKPQDQDLVSIHGTISGAVSA